MLPFKVDFKPGESSYRQVIYEAKKAIVAGQLLPGAEFPSVRALSKELKINPNTAHKVVAELTREGMLEVRPGIGTFVAPLPSATSATRSALLRNELEEVIVEAKRLGLTLSEVRDAIERHWARLSTGSCERGAHAAEGVKGDADEDDSPSALRAG